jgi:hypothetical protein
LQVKAIKAQRASSKAPGRQQPHLRVVLFMEASCGAPAWSATAQSPFLKVSQRFDQEFLNIRQKTTNQAYAA